jgi:hypothetical protein
MKSLNKLWNMVLLDMGTMCHVSTIRDVKTVAERLEHEGVSFITITLTNFAKDFEKSLAREFVDRDLFAGFGWRGGLPRFLGGFLDLVFDRSTGRLLDVPSTDAIYAVRQLTLLFGKIALECTIPRQRKALAKYIECEKDVRISDRNMDEGLLEDFRRMSLILFGDVLASVDRKVFDNELVPKHGPGATADKLRGNAKFDQTEWTERLENILPFGEHAIPNWRYNYRLDSANILEPGAERPVRVVLVPKTLKTPRIIAIEPACMQYMQQAISEQLVIDLERDSLVSPMIGFSDQEPNRYLAERGSKDGSLATIDLSEASDRVSNQHVRLLLRHFPHLSEAVDATRSRKAEVPGYGVIRLAKFASMGSALCFPMEAMVFLTVVFLGIQKAQRRQLTRKDVQSYSGSVRVYGDDIVVPTDCMESVVLALESFGLKVNEDKSFGTGRFRESCGREYYDGADVSIVRVRHVLPSRRRDEVEVIAAVSLRNRFYEAGCWNAAFWLDSEIGPLLGGRYPRVSQDSPVLGRVSYLGYETQRVSPKTHVPQVKGWCVYSKPPASKVSGEGALLKWFLKRGDEPFVDRDHLTRYGRPDAVRTKLRWAMPFSYGIVGR